MTEKEVRRAYFRQYYRNNPDKYKMVGTKKNTTDKTKKEIKKNKPPIPQFSVKRGEFMIKFN